MSPWASNNSLTPSTLNSVVPAWFTPFSGAAADGATNDLSAFTRAAGSGSPLITVPPGTYLVNGQISIATGQTWMLAGVTILQTSAQTLFNAAQVDDWALVGPFQIQGSGNSSTASGAVGIAATAGNKWRIQSPSFLSLAGTGFLALTGNGAGTYRGDTGQIIAPIAENCNIGMCFNSGGGAEYSNVVAPMISGCSIGAIVTAGNTGIVGGSITDNMTNLQMTGGANHAHGVVVGTNLNHGVTYNLQCVSVSNGQSFVGCHFYSSTVLLTGSQGIIFDGGHMTGTIQNDAGTANGFNYLRGMYCPSALVVAGSAQTTLVIQNCTGDGSYAAGVTINDPAPVYLLATRAIGATQVMTGATTLVFPTKTFDRRGSFNSNTGVFTSPTSQAGTYSIRGQLFFSASTFTTASYVDVRVNGVAQNLFVGSIYTSSAQTFLAIPVNAETYLNSGDSVALVANVFGSNVSFGGTTYQSQLAIERLA